MGVDAVTNPATVSIPGADRRRPVAALHLAIVQAAVDDTVNAIDGRHQPHRWGFRGRPPRPPRTAVARMMGSPWEPRPRRPCSQRGRTTAGTRRSRSRSGPSRASGGPQCRRSSRTLRLGWERSTVRAHERLAVPHRRPESADERGVRPGLRRGQGLGSASSLTRTPEQTAIARFFTDHAVAPCGTVPWNRWRRTRPSRSPTKRDPSR
jgi:hypothetical protein